MNKKREVKNCIERFSIECPKVKNKVITLTNNKEHRQSNEPIKKLDVMIRIADAKRGKTCANELQLVLALLLIGQKSGTSFISQPCGVYNAKQITFPH